MRLIDADALKEKFKEHYDLFVSAYKNEQDMSLADKSRVDEILNSMAEVINAPTIFDTDNATNGEVLKALFPNEHDFETDFDADWWNAPYQQEYLGGELYEGEFENR